MEPGPNTSKSGSGWYNGPVTMKFSCDDPSASNGASGSGVATCSDPVTLSTDGANQEASGAAEDIAGNARVPASVNGVNIASTPPVIKINGLTQTTLVLGNAPSLSCEASDATSGLAGPESKVPLNLLEHPS